MAIILEAAYSKKLGLPNFSSHSFVVSIRTELSDLTRVEEESARLYHLLQQSVDSEIQQVGYLPDATSYGMDGHHHVEDKPDGHHSAADDYQQPGADTWMCSDKQREFVLKLIADHHLDKREVEALAKEMFGAPVKTLNRLQASGLIDRLLELHGGKKNGSGNGNGRPGNQGGKYSARRPTPTRE